MAGTMDSIELTTEEAIFALHELRGKCETPEQRAALELALEYIDEWHSI